MLYAILENWQPVLALAGLVAFWLWESWNPFFEMTGRLKHAVRNLSLAGINAALTVLAFSALTAAAAVWTANHDFGLLPQMEAPIWATIGVGMIALDLWTYLWHRANHRIPLLWRFHRMHHSDENMDVTTATRFHFGEIAISTAVRLGPVLLLGIPAEAILAYDIVLLVVTQFHHANIGLLDRMDRRLRYIIVTPNMHRVHHSQERPETDSNYASVLSLWDRVFRTYRERADYRRIRYGLAQMVGDRYQTFRGMMGTPFRRLPEEADG
ncbi:MAG: sterol desaturase family protein [Bryobacteraceae bacterium]|nr:sterol desaturase family protein [Bryobacteraceae bacterium]